MKQGVKKALKIAGIVLGVLLLAVVGFVVYVQLTWSLDRSDTPFPDIQASSDPAEVARGEYLVHHVAHCSTCHQPGEIAKEHGFDKTKPLTGGYTVEAGPFGTFVVANITPHPEAGIGKWSDAELARAIKHCVGKDGNLLPFMLLATGPMADEDVRAIMSYLRAQAPHDVKQKRDEYGFLAKFLSDEFQPRMESPTFVEEGTTSVERGKYLAEGPAACSGCHTPRDPMEGFAPTGPLLSGSKEDHPDASDENYVFRAPNLTPHPETGHIASWDEATFVARFRAGRAYKGSIMPWDAYSGMTDDDLKSIYRYLAQLPPTKNKIGETRRKAD